MSEADVLKSCRHRLDYWLLKGVVLHFDRLNSGKMQFEGRYVQFCKAGTPDLIAYFKFKGICWVYFIECKSANGVLRPSQKAFKDKFLSVNNIIYEVVRSSKQIDITIESITNHDQNILDSIVL